jgi:hypothetical protein
MDSLFRWVQVGVFLLGSPFLVIGGKEAFNTWAELGRDVRAFGNVVENRLVADQRDGIEEHAYVPVVEFPDLGGRITRFTDPNGSLPPDYTIGERVEVAFDPAEPSRARLISWKRLWLVPTMLIGVGLLPSFVLAIVFRRISRGAPR